MVKATVGTTRGGRKSVIPQTQPLATTGVTVKDAKAAASKKLPAGTKAPAAIQSKSTNKAPAAKEEDEVEIEMIDTASKKRKAPAASQPPTKKRVSSLPKVGQKRPRKSSKKDLGEDNEEENEEEEKHGEGSENEEDSSQPVKKRKLAGGKE